MRNVIALLLLASLFAACTGEAGSGNQAASRKPTRPRRLPRRRSPSQPQRRRPRRASAAQWSRPAITSSR